SETTAAVPQCEKSRPAWKWSWFCRAFPPPPVLPCRAEIHRAAIEAASRVECADREPALTPRFHVTRRFPPPPNRGATPRSDLHFADQRCGDRTAAPPGSQALPENPTSADKRPRPNRSRESRAASACPRATPW